MEILEYIIGGILLLLAVALIWIIGVQQSKRKSGLSGSIAGSGASESYLARHNIASKESSYKKITLILAIVFIVLVVALYIIGSIDTTETVSDATSSAATSSVAASSTATSSVAESSVAESSVAESSVAESVAVSE